MGGGLRLIALALGLLAGPVLAQELTTSPRPMPRPVAADQAQPSVQPSAQDAAQGAAPATRPRPRPASLAAAAPVPAAPGSASVQDAAQDTAQVTAPTLRPRPRPASFAAAAPVPTAYVQTAAQVAAPLLRPVPRPRSWAQNPPEATAASAANPAPQPKGGLFGGLFGRRKPAEPVPTDGYVCGDPDIRGDELAPVSSKVQGCGIEEPVRVTSVDGIRLTTPATINCTTAKALKTWINEGMRPAFGNREVVELRIAASYICRLRNNVRGAKISEHGRGKAVDISGFIMADGKEWSIAGDYNRTIRRAHKAACGIFGTTLGPGSDGYHEDHLHFDTANLDRPYCR